MLSKKTKESPINALLVPLNRIAIDSSGRPGSLYDGYRDRVLRPPNMKNYETSCQGLILKRCTILKGIHVANLNVLKITSVEQELRLSILLNITNKTGIATIMDYYHPINEYTRFFLYSYLEREEQLPDNPTVFDKLALYLPNATHIITQVCFGLDFIVILQLPSDSITAVAIDRVLHKLCKFLKNNDNVYKLNIHEENLLEKIVRTKVCSNIPDMRHDVTMGAVYRYIEQTKNNFMDYAVYYTLRPIKWLYRQSDKEGATFISLPSELNDAIEQYVLQSKDEIKKIETFINGDLKDLLCGQLKERFFNVQTQCSHVNEKCKDEVERLSRLVIDVRNGRVRVPAIDQAFNNNERISMQHSIRDLVFNLNKLREDGYLIYNRNQQKFQYPNVNGHIIDRGDVNMTNIREPVTDDQRGRMFYLNTEVEKNKSEQFYKSRASLFEEHGKNVNTRRVDTTYSSLPSHLSTMITSPSSNETYKDVNKYGSGSSFAIVQTATSPHVKRQIFIRSPSPNIPDIRSSKLPESTDGTINILLLGETGVGKSTFINAFANYLTFNTIREAEAGQSRVLIPVSFLITVGHNFEERIVKFRGIDTSNNEDFDHPGQSVTQYCKSYVFQPNVKIGQKLRIIDTPGFGDTRGLDQDDRNMQHILEYINNLSHLNAICFLLKPNASRLNIFFRSCFIQLFSLLGSNARNNIIFCFTNARSTFYTPGDTAPLIKNMLNALSVGDIPFKKDNTFCFDNEAFRYLVALQNRITFDNNEKQEYEMSWTYSMKEANRLISFIQNTHRLPIRIRKR